jgi:hypothetical protein
MIFQQLRRLPGFESRQVLRENVAILCLIDLIRIACVMKKKSTAIDHFVQILRLYLYMYVIGNHIPPKPAYIIVHNCLCQ